LGPSLRVRIVTKLKRRLPKVGMGILCVRVHNWKEAVVFDI